MWWKKPAVKTPPPISDSDVRMDAAAFTLAEFAEESGSPPYCWIGQAFSPEQEKAFQGWCGLFRRNLDLAICVAPGAARDLGLTE